jgi:hypothetical protein
VPPRRHAKGYARLVGSGIEIEHSEDIDWSRGPIELPVVGFAVQIIEFPVRHARQRDHNGERGSASDCGERGGEVLGGGLDRLRNRDC